MTRWTRIAVVATLVVAASMVGAAAPPAAPAQTTPADSATIHPGVQTFTAGAQCTANFVFVDGAHVLIGQAAHCSSVGAATDTNGCLAESLPLGTPVDVAGASQPGTMVYNSWLTMQEAGETDPDACAFNDFALVQLHPDDVSRVNPSVPHWGGPQGLTESGTVAGDPVYSYGNSSLRGGITLLSPKTGISLGSTGNGWSHDVYTVTPGIPGDSGSAFLDADGNALGVLSTLQVAPLVGSNGVSDLARALDYLAAHTDLDVELATGTEPFAPNLLPIGGLRLRAG